MVKGALPECPKQPTKEKNKMEGKLKKGKQNKQKERKKKKKKEGNRGKGSWKEGWEEKTNRKEK